MTLTQITKIRGAGIHTTSNIVSHNINSSGIITAVAFKGPFTGSSNIQSGIVTATKIDLNGDIDVDGHTNLDNVSIAGVVVIEKITQNQDCNCWIMENDKSVKIQSKNEIPLGHKIAMIDLNEGDTILKYGHDIGKVVKSIKKGEHVHVHNVKTKKW